MFYPKSAILGENIWNRRQNTVTQNESHLGSEMAFIHLLSKWMHFIPVHALLKSLIKAMIFFAIFWEQQ